MVGTAAALSGSGCAERKTSEAPYLYYSHFYTEARQVVRADALDRRSPEVILDNLRLGLASMAYGDLEEAEAAMLRAYEYLVGGRVNPAGREAAATVGQEGVRVWTPEPYERAMAFYHIAALYMRLDDWENARAALRNALFALETFDVGEDGEVTKETVESEFALGHLLLGLARRVTGDVEASVGPLERAVELRPDLEALSRALAEGGFDTLLLIEYGRGPRKKAVGPNRSEIVFEPDGRGHPPPRLSIEVDGRRRAIPTDKPAVDLWVLSQFPKWWSLASARRAKSALGEFLTRAGIGAAVIGAAEGSEEAVIAGAGAIFAGVFLQSGAEADARHLAILPRGVYIVPLDLGPGRHKVDVRFTAGQIEDRLAGGAWHDLVPGSDGRPRVYTLRMHDGNGRGMPDWPDAPRYFVEHTGVPADTTHYLLGGRDLSVPEDPDLRRLFQTERGVVFRPGDPNAVADGGDNPAPDPDLYRHVSEGGRVLWTPAPGTFGYQRITRSEHPPYPDPIELEPPAASGR